ncbi:MAG: hypothetical protein ACREFZ_10480 [Acetobacteraceae bacterium]
MSFVTLLGRFARRLPDFTVRATNFALYGFVMLRAHLDPRPTIRSASPLNAGLRLGTGRAAIARGSPLNPTSDFWRPLFPGGFPFLERELLRKNPTCIADLWEWREIVAEASEINAAVLLADLARSARNRAP